MLLDFRKPPYNVQEKVVSYTGKYLGFYGTHFHEGKLCYVVGASNKSNGEIITRHYNESTCINIETAQYACRKLWEETLKPGLLKTPSHSEEQEASDQLADLFERVDAAVRKRSKKVQRLQ